jgi:hypothetical protein
VEKCWNFNAANDEEGSNNGDDRDDNCAESASGTSSSAC